MNKLLKLIYSNKFFAIITLLIQIGMIAMYIMSASTNIRYYMLVSNLISCVLILFEVNRREESMYKITWIMLMATIPVFGWFFYLYTHTGVISGNMRKAHINAGKMIAEYKPDDSGMLNELCRKSGSQPLAKYLSKASVSSVCKNTEVKYYPLGDDMFVDIISELEKAEKFILMEFFIINAGSDMWRKTEEILVRKAAEGVDVRLMYDGMGCMAIMPKGYDKILQSKGIKCEIFAPVQPLLSTYQNNRDHRKVVVVDGRCAFSGGINLSDEYINEIERFGHWKDTGIMLRGEGVAGFTAMFLHMWCTVSDEKDIDIRSFVNSAKNYTVANPSGYVIPFSDSPLDDKPVGRTAYVDILNTATDYVHIMTPYFVIDESIFDAMSYAVMRGVNIKLILPGIPDKKIPYCLARSYYKDLLDIGVEIYEYIPGFVHAKTTVSDGRKAIVGTINYDYRSLYLHYECAAYMIDVDQIAEMEDDMINTLARCRRITEREYAELPGYYRAGGRMLRFIATMI